MAGVNAGPSFRCGGDVFFECYSPAPHDPMGHSDAQADYRCRRRGVNNTASVVAQLAQARLSPMSSFVVELRLCRTDCSSRRHRTQRSQPPERSGVGHERTRRTHASDCRCNSARLSGTCAAGAAGAALLPLESFAQTPAPGRALQRRAEEWMTALTIKNPAAMTRMLAPGFPDLL
jgi:hypothetical protein